MRTDPSDSSGDIRAWISSRASKICCCSLSRISAARVSMLRIRSKDIVELLFSVTAECLRPGEGETTGAYPRRRTGKYHPRKETAGRGQATSPIRLQGWSVRLGN
ncbi:hypothetical protein Lesp02_25110 [Lentzea sp. NBRC 105346]|nr:hypothetical protein Lesp02_25110 [Lentzea sp. NBRC 105346]